MGDACKLLNVEHLAARVRYCFAEQNLCVRSESLLYFLLAAFGVDEGALYAELLHRYAEQVVGSAVNFV